MIDSGTPGITRRALLGASLATLLPGVIHPQEPARSQDDTAGTASARLPRPDMAGRPRSRVTDYENDPFIVGIESELRCTCGCNLSVYTCRTTDFTCQTSPAMHQEVIGRVEEGKTGEQILDEFVAKYGETVLMAPRKQGFNIAAYIVPGIVITAVGSVMLWILARRARLMPRTVSDESGDSLPGLSPDEVAQLQAELEHLER